MNITKIKYAQKKIYYIATTYSVMEDNWRVGVLASIYRKDLTKVYAPNDESRLVDRLARYWPIAAMLFQTRAYSKAYSRFEARTTIVSPDFLSSSQKVELHLNNHTRTKVLSF